MNYIYTLLCFALLCYHQSHADSLHLDESCSFFGQNYTTSSCEWTYTMFGSRKKNSWEGRAVIHVLNSMHWSDINNAPGNQHFGRLVGAIRFWILWLCFKGGFCTKIYWIYQLKTTQIHELNEFATLKYSFSFSLIPNCFILVERISR